jgi:hypothetical protein
MSFAIIPPVGPPRLFRFYAGGEEMPVAILEPEHNLLYINKDKYDRLSSIERHMVLRTHQRIIDSTPYSRSNSHAASDQLPDFRRARVRHARVPRSC